MGQHCSSGHPSSALQLKHRFGQITPEKCMMINQSMVKLKIGHTWKITACLSQNVTFRNKTELKGRMNKGKASQEQLIKSLKAEVRRRSLKSFTPASGTWESSWDFLSPLLYLNLSSVVILEILSHFFSLSLYQAVTRKNGKQCTGIGWILASICKFILCTLSLLCTH